MNKICKNVWNDTTGTWVAASELAPGKGKSGKLRLSVSTAFVSAVISATCPAVADVRAAVYDEYRSGSLVKDAEGYVESVNTAETASYKGREQRFTSGSTDFTLNNKVKWTPESEGPTAGFPASQVGADVLAEKGSITVTDKNGNVISYPTLTDWNLNAQGSEQFVDITDSDGNVIANGGTVYNIDALQVTHTMQDQTDFQQYIVTGQPTQPFVDLRIATVSGAGSVLNLNAAEAIDWTPGQVKQSSLFKAENTATLNQNQDIRVVFTSTNIAEKLAGSAVRKGTFGPDKKLVDALSYKGVTYTLGNGSDAVQNLKNYNDVLVADLKAGTLTQTQYFSLIRRAWTTGEKDYSYEYDPGLLNYDTDHFYFTDEMKAGIGIRAIFEAEGKGTTLNLNNSIEAVGQAEIQAYNVWAHDNATVNSAGNITVGPNTQNALISSGAHYTNTATGTLTFGTNKDGSRFTNWADQVYGSDSVYENAGHIAISNSPKNDAEGEYPNGYALVSRNIGTEVSSGASALNNGTYTVGSSGASADRGTATGIHIRGSGSAVNNTGGVIDIVAESGGSGYLSVDVANNGISVQADGTNPVSVKNKGIIRTSEKAVNSVAINVELSKGVQNGSNITADNTGTIDVRGNYTVGIKAGVSDTGQTIREADGNSITNHGTINVYKAGSSGIWADTGAEITNAGTVNVNGATKEEGIPSEITYGIRAKGNGAVVNLTDGSLLKLTGSYVNGLYATAGAEIHVRGGDIKVARDENAVRQTVFWISDKNAEDGNSSRIIFEDSVDFDLDNQSSTLFRVDQGAIYKGSESKVATANINGENGTGYTIATNGTVFESGKTTINVSGKGATGINVNSGAGLDGNVVLTEDTIVNAYGEGSTVAVVDGNNYNLAGQMTGNSGAKLKTQAQLNSTGSNATVLEKAIGYKVINRGELIQNGTIDFSNAKDTTGVYLDGGTLTNNGDIASNNIGLDVYKTGLYNSVVSNYGTVSAVDGTAAIRMNQNTTLTLKETGLVSATNSADGVRAMSGSTFYTDRANIAVDGTGSAIHFMNTASGETGGTFTLSGSGTVTVKGDNAAGITLEAQDENGNPAMSDGNLNSTGANRLVITVLDKGGNGIVTNTSGYVHSGASVNIMSAEGQSALVVKGTTTDITQVGKLTSLSATSAVVDLTFLQPAGGKFTFANSGTIDAQGGSLGIDASNQNGNNTFTNSGSGSITGGVKGGSGNNTFTASGSAYTDQVTFGDGDNTVNLTGTSKTDRVVLGDGSNTVNIYGGTTNGSILSGNGSGQFNLIAVGKAQSANAFSSIDGGLGKDILTVTSKSYYLLTDPAKIQNIEKLVITGNSTVEASNVDLQLSAITGDEDSNVVRVDTGSTFFINQNLSENSYNLIQNVKGTGTLKTDTNGYAFNFANPDFMSANFNGTLDLNNGTFQISGSNTKALTHATLRLSAENGAGIATLPDKQDVQVIKGLSFNGGTLNVERNFIGDKESASTGYLQVTDLDVNGKGTVNLKTDGFDNDYAEKVLKDISKKNLLQQDNGENIVKIVDVTGSVTGNGSSLTINLKDNDGNAVVAPSAQEIRQNNEVVATGTYGVGANIVNDSDDKGLYAAYRLLELDLHDGKTLNLQSAAVDTSTEDQDLKAKLTGSGNIEINAYSDHVSLSNSSNDFTGSTTVNHGVLLLAADRALGQETAHTSSLVLQSGTEARFGNTTQYIGSLNNKNGAKLALDDGSLNISEGGSSSGSITSSSAANLNINGGTLTVNGANTGYHGTTAVADKATAIITNTDGLGDGLINVDGILNIDHAAGTLANSIKKAGAVNIRAGSDVTLSGNNSGFTGTFDIYRADTETVSTAATLRASEQKHLGSATVINNGNLYLTQNADDVWTVENSITGSGTLYKKGTGILELTTPSSAYTGHTQIDEGTLLAGSTDTPADMQTALMTIAAGARFAGYGSIAGNVKNSGTFTVGGLDKSETDTVTRYLVKGSFDNAGSIILGSNNGTGSTLTVNGNYLSNGGSLYMNTVLNEGGENTETDRLIVGGNVLTGVGGSTLIYVKPVGGSGAYTQPDAIKIVDVAGTTSYDAFRLGTPVAIGVYEYRLNKGTKDNSWYLSSYNPVFPPGENENTPALRYVNPQIGAYMANRYALSMFNLTMHDRLGEPQYAESLKTENSKSAGSAWVRVQADNERFTGVENQLKIKGNKSFVQAGTDLIRWGSEDKYRGRLGIMAAYGTGNMDSTSRRTGTAATGKIKSAYSVGVYGTVYQNAENPNGFYVDVWGMYNRYKNEVSLSGYESAKYKSRGYNLSVEAGRTFVISGSEDGTRQWQFQPQVQLIYGHLKSDASNNQSGLSLGSNTLDSLESRLGARVTYVPDREKTRRIQPFAELNWHHQFKNKNILFFNDDFDFSDQVSANRYEVKTGFEAQMGKNWNGWANVSYSVGSHQYRKAKGMAGIKYQW